MSDGGDGLPRGGAVPSEIFDRQDLQLRMGGDEQMVRDVVSVFLTDAPLQLRDLRRAYERGDPADIRDRAHGIKGAAASLSAPALRDAALILELAGAAGDIAAAGEALTAVERELERLTSLLRDQ